jgi:Secretion system C-terminal sorting domain
VYYQAYLYTNKLKYKNIAIAIGDYLSPLKFNTNYNYNSFVSLGLTRAFQLSNDSNYLRRAIINIRFGVLPGQLQTGRWVDGHNAKSVYHAIIIKNTAATLNLIDGSNQYHNSLKNMATKAIRNYIGYYKTCNYSGTFYWAMRSYLLNASILNPSLKDSISDIIGKHIQQAKLSGNYMDVATMGDYLELLSTVNSIPKNFGANIKFELFPNPTSTLLNLNMNLAEKYKVSIRNVLGQTVYTDFNTSQINVSNLISGLYFISIEHGLRTATQKFIKE